MNLLARLYHIIGKIENFGRNFKNTNRYLSEKLI